MMEDLEKARGLPLKSSYAGRTFQHDKHVSQKQDKEYRADAEQHNISPRGSARSSKLSAAQSAADTASSGTTRCDSEAPNRKVISFELGDPENPYNWSSRKKVAVIVVESSTVINCTLGTSLPAGATEQLSTYFHVPDESQLVLLTSIYLVGFVLGPLVFGPLSESFGRRNIMMGCFSVFSAFTLGAALAPNWPALVIFRFITGVAASCPIAVVGGICADIYDSPVLRGRAMAVFMSATSFGPCFGPIISGFVSEVSWRWTFWVGLIIAGASWIPLFFMPETYGPVLLKWRAQRMRRETGDIHIMAPIELEKVDIRQIVTVVLTRPFRMLIFEPVVSLTCLYLSLVYAIFYTGLQSYPLIFRDTYGFSAGQEGLTFLAIGVGSVIACGFYLVYDGVIERAKARDAPWSRREESRRLPLAVVGGPFIVISLFWLGWTARESTHWIVPSLSGIPFGIGFLLMFMSLLNYLVDAYAEYSASSMAASSATRAIFGTCLPFAARPMYLDLGIPWACSLLGFLMAIMCFIPPLFWVYGERLRARSPFCQHLLKRREQKEEARRETERGGDMLGRVRSVGSLDPAAK